jgi:2-polyprenyl-3-methyl-5-hydroxy-6-metoxy-1,4-benzoquinol methylase
MAEGSSPDVNAAGLLREPVDPLRYEFGRTIDKNEVPGIVAGMIPRGAKVLDIGCGEGVLTKLLADACHAEFFGIEADPTRAARAKERGLRMGARRWPTLFGAQHLIKAKKQ